jgi:hypothetical protein
MPGEGDWVRHPNGGNGRIASGPGPDEAEEHQRDDRDNGHERADGTTCSVSVLRMRLSHDPSLAVAGCR